MRTSFRFVAVSSERFAGLFDRDDEDLRAVRATRMIVDRKPGFPCRVSLADAEVGETVVLIPFTHHDVASPYHSSGPIFVRQNVTTANPNVDEIPAMLQHRLLSVRAYDHAGLMVAAEVVEGSDLEVTIRHLFQDASVEYLQIHNARPGCYNCTVVRA